jgi:hypothetical protein
MAFVAVTAASLRQMRALTPVVLSATIVIAAASAVGCGSSSPQHTSTQATATHALQPTPRLTTTPAQPTHPPIGATQPVHAAGATLSVAVTRLIDPLRGSGAALQPGTRAVGVLVRISNKGPGIYDSSATGDISIVPSAGITTPVFASQGVCQTPLQDWDNYIVPGQQHSGCVVFSIDSDAKLLAVRFSPHGQAAGRTTWSASS